ncbi:MAG: hypothetical protein M3Z08_06795 [Chloroflexota bacterium]|nr:hypothetical protein [Chloroflexota bacterium]
MSETRDPEQEPSPAGEMPEEFRLFKEAIHTTPDSLASDSPLDIHIATWEQILSAWDRYLRDSSYRPQALQIRLPALLNGGRLYFLRFRQTQRVEDLERALQLRQEAYQQLPQGDPELPAIENNLLYMLNTLIELQGRRYNQSHDVQDVQRSNQLCEQALSLTAHDPTHRPRYLYYLSQGCKELYRLAGEREPLEQALAHLSEATEICPPDSPYLFPSLELLGYTLRERFTYTDDLADLRGASEAWQRAARIGAPAAPEMRTLLNNVGDIMVAYYKRTQDRADLEKFIQFCEEAVNASPQDAPGLVDLLSFYSYGLSQRYEHTHESADLEQAIQCMERAVALSAASPEQRSSSLNNLGNMLHVRYTSVGDSADIDRAIAAYEEAIALPLADASAKIPTYFNLATTLVDRYERTKEPTDLTRAIDACQDALGLNPPDPHSASRCAKLLSGLLRERYTYTQDENDLKRAVVFEKEWSV